MDKDNEDKNGRYVGLYHIDRKIEGMRESLNNDLDWLKEQICSKIVGREKIDVDSILEENFFCKKGRHIRRCLQGKGIDKSILAEGGYYDSFAGMEMLNLYCKELKQQYDIKLSGFELKMKIYQKYGEEGEK